jgi:hypothetical protein
LKNEVLLTMLLSQTAFVSSEGEELSHHDSWQMATVLSECDRRPDTWSRSKDRFRRTASANSGQLLLRVDGLIVLNELVRFGSAAFV